MRAVVAVTLAVGLVLVAGSGFGATSASDKITLCHGSAGSWNAITVSVNAGLGGHDGHAEDIIPAFTTVDNQGNVTNYPGKNLDTNFGEQSGGDVLGNGCVAPVAPPSELAHLAVIVKVVNNNGGTKGPSDFTVTVSGNGRSVSFVGNDDPGWRYSGEGGSYAATQSSDPDYTTTSSGCSGTVPAGGDATCVFTNDDIGEPEPVQPPIAPLPGPTPLTPSRPSLPSGPGSPVVPITPVLPIEPDAPVAPIETLARLTVVVMVINDDGGTARPSGFTALISGVDVVDGPSTFPGAARGTDRTVTPGSYAVQESTLAGYQTVYSDGCVGILARGAHARCVIVNNDIGPTSPGKPGPPRPPGPGQPGSGEPAKLTVITVVRNGGGSLTPNDFVDLIAGTPVLSGPAVFRGRSRTGVTRIVQPGGYGVYQNKRLNYARTYRGACSGTIQAGEHKTCTVVNTRQRLPSGKIYDLTVAMTAQPTVAAGRSVTWTIVVTNLGPATAPGVAVAHRIPDGFRVVRGTLRVLTATRQPECTVRERLTICRLGTLQRGAQRTLQVTARARRVAGGAPAVAATLGTSFEVKYRNNVARTAVQVARRPSCPPGSRSFAGTCHAIVAGSG